MEGGVVMVGLLVAGGRWLLCGFGAALVVGFQGFWRLLVCFKWRERERERERERVNKLIVLAVV